jgi:hypothetical protein
VEIARARITMARSFGRDLATQGLLQEATRNDEMARARRAASEP